MRHRPRKSRRSSYALRVAAAMAAAVPVLALTPAAQASSGDAPGDAGQPNLVVSELSTTATLVPGEVSHGSVTLTNNGTSPADGVVFRMRLTRGLDFPEHMAGCTYSTISDQVRQALCHLDVTIDPGASASVPLPIKVLSKALMETVEYGTSATGGDPGEGYTESYRRSTVEVDSTADLAAVGDHARGRAGQTVTVTAALRNDGPGWVQNNVSDDQPALMVNIPAGTVAVRVPADCVPFAIDGPSGPSQPGKPQYVCSPPDYTLEVGSVHAYTFRLKIERGTQSTSGEVKATSVYDIHPAFDHNAANDTATISVFVHEHRSGSGPGSGSSPAPTSSASASASGAHSPTAADASQTQTQTDKKSDIALASHTSDDSEPAGNDTSATPLVAAATAGAAGLGGLLVLRTVRRRRARSI